jgi:hypothetical protein
VPCRRAAVAAAAVLALGAGCADDVAPAASVPPEVVISNDDLLAEVEAWAESPVLLEQVGVTSTEGAGPGSFDSRFVGVVLTNRIRFDLHREELEASGGAPSEADESTVREQLAAVLEELDPDLGDRLVTDLAAVGAVSSALGDDYEEWFTEATADVDVNPRYGSWDQAAGAVLPPEGPRQPAAATLGGP